MNFAWIPISQYNESKHQLPIARPHLSAGDLVMIDTHIVPVPLVDEAYPGIDLPMGVCIQNAAPGNPVWVIDRLAINQPGKPDEPVLFVLIKVERPIGVAINSTTMLISLPKGEIK